MNSNFDEFYQRIYGKRWAGLRECLLQPSAPIPYSDGLSSPYYLDYASVLAAKALRLPFGEVEDPPLILDACAAPGGKSLVIASRMSEHAVLLANDLSSERRRRLSDVLDKYLHVPTRSRVTVSGFDAAALPRRKTERGRFAAILLDVPCSSERHVIQDQTALDKWTSSRPRYLAKRQWALLSAAFLLLAPGGSLVYSTCSINPDENDGVAARLIKKYGKGKQGGNAHNGPKEYCVIDKPDFTEGEESEYGRIILPDVCNGKGPLYVARFRKIMWNEELQMRSEE